MPLVCSQYEAGLFFSMKENITNVALMLMLDGRFYKTSV